MRIHTLEYVPVTETFIKLFVSCINFMLKLHPSILNLLHSLTQFALYATFGRVEVQFFIHNFFKIVLFFDYLCFQILQNFNLPIRINYKAACNQCAPLLYKIYYYQSIQICIIRSSDNTTLNFVLRFFSSSNV